MNFCLVNSDGIIANIISCENEAVAKGFGALPLYDGASIGAAYDPPPAPDPAHTTEDRVAALEAENKTLKAQVSAQSEQMNFYEECIAEMASVVYA